MDYYRAAVPGTTYYYASAMSTLCIRRRRHDLALAEPLDICSALWSQTRASRAVLPAEGVDTHDLGRWRADLTLTRQAFV